MSRYTDAARVRRRAQYADELRDGEVLVLNYCRDLAGCSCAATHAFTGVECMPIARTGKGARLGPHTKRQPGVDRCLQCDARWERRDYRTDPLVVLNAEAGS